MTILENPKTLISRVIESYHNTRYCGFFFQAKNVTLSSSDHSAVIRCGNLTASRETKLNVTCKYCNRQYAN